MKSIISIILIISSISFFVFFTKPKWDELRANEVELSNLEIAQDNAKKLKSQIDALLKTKNSINQNDLDKMKRMIPSNIENVKLIIEFDDIVQGVVNQNKTLDIYKKETQIRSLSDISIDNPSITKTDSISSASGLASNLETVEFSFNVSLTYRDFISFIQILEKSIRVFDIKSISFNAPQSKTLNPSEIVYNFNVKLDTYWLKSK